MFITKSKLKIIFVLIFLNCTLLIIFSKDAIEVDINEAILLAIAKNPDIKISKASLKIRNKAFFYELRKFLPTLNMGVSNSASVSFDAPDSRSTSLNLGFNVLVFDSGKLIFDYVVNKTELEFSKKELKIEINKLIADTKNKYYSLLLLLEKEKQQKELLKIGLIQEEHAELELEVGTISSVDYYDIKLRVSEINIDVEKIKREKNKAFRDFKYQIGLEDSDILLNEKIVYELLDLTSDSTGILQDIALANRLEMSQSFHSQLKSKIQLYYTIFSFLPEVTTGFNFSLTDEEFPPRQKSWSINFDIKIPLAYLPINYSPSVGGSGTNVKRSKSDKTNVDIAENITYENDISKSRIDIATEGIKYKELTRNIREDVRNLIEDYIESLNIYKLKLKQNEVGLKKLNIMRLKLEIGEVKRVDLLEEEMDYNESIIEEKEMLYQLILKELKLQETLGLNSINISINNILKNHRIYNISRNMPNE